LSNAETDWTKEIQVYPYIKTQLYEELQNVPPQKIYLGYETDPYQPAEAECRQTRRVLELLLREGFSASILTKSDLVLRDLKLLTLMQDASVSISVAFTDDEVRAQFEGHTIRTQTRIEALRKLQDAGIRTSALICPVIPHITDVRSLIDWLEPYARVIWIYGLSVRDRYEPCWQNVRSILAQGFPHHKEQTETVIFNKEHHYWKELRHDLEEIKETRNLDLRIHI
jgi:DNA repair photolyase